MRLRSEERIYSAFARRIGYPALDFARGRKLMARYDELLANEKLSPASLNEKQLSALRALVVHAASTSPYYERRFGSVATAREIDYGTLATLPVLTKRAIQTHREAIVSRKFDRSKLVPGRSGGSTGEPTQFYHDRNALDYLRAATLRSLGWAGYQLGSKVVKVSGSHFDYDLSKRVSVRIASALLRQRWLSAIDLDEASLENKLRKFREWNPSFFWGYASAIHSIAKYLLERNEKFPLRAVITSSDNLSDSMRATIADAFDCPVFDAYSTREVTIGWECEEHAGFHINSDVSYVEVVDDDDHPLPAGASGRLLVTDLHNYAFPFIRYEIGDRATMSPDICRCGRPFPLLLSLDGRSDDFIVGPEGARIAAPAFTILMSDLASLRNFQVLQASDYSVTVRLATEPTWSAADERHLREGLDAMLRQIPYRIEIVDSIDYGESGKRRVICSDAARR